MSVNKLARGSIFLYIGTILSGLIGYAYLFITSSFVSSEVVGIVAAILSVQGLVSMISVFGLPSGVQRFLGHSLAKRDYGQLSRHLGSAFVFSCISTIISVLVVAVVILSGIGILGLTHNQLSSLILLIIVSGGWQMVLSALFYSNLSTQIIAITQIVPSLVKLAVGWTMLILGFEFAGVIAGYVAGALLADILLIYYVVRCFREYELPTFQLLTMNRLTLRELLRTSVANWIPATLRTAGEKVGVLTVVSFLGLSAAGLYFVAFSVVSLIFAIPASFLSLLLPVISGMSDGRKRAFSKALKFSLAITAPMALILTLYPENLLSLIGAEYVAASNQLRVLAIGALLAPIVMGYMSYVYAIGRNLHLFLIGLIFSGSQLLLYPILLLFLDDLGAPIAYASSFFIALLGIVPSGLKVGYRFEWLTICSLIVIPGAITVGLYFLQLGPNLGVPCLLILTMLVYARVGLIKKQDAFELMQGFISEKSIARVSKHAKPLIRIMYGLR